MWSSPILYMNVFDSLRVLSLFDGVMVSFWKSIIYYMLYGDCTTIGNYVLRRGSLYVISTSE